MNSGEQVKVVCKHIMAEISGSSRVSVWNDRFSSIPRCPFSVPDLSVASKLRIPRIHADMTSSFWVFSPPGSVLGASRMS